MQKILIKSTISFAILFYIISISNINKFIEIINFFKVIDFLIPIFLIFIQVSLSAERWKQVSIILGHTFTINFAIRIQLVGMFFNNVLPSTIGGDIYRIWQIKSKIGKFQDALNSVIGDRIVAFFSMLILVSLNIFFLKTTISHYIFIFLILLIFAILVNKYKKYRFEFYQYLERVKFIQPFIIMIYSIDNLFSSKKFVLLVLISFIIHIISSFMFYYISISLNMIIPFKIFLIIIPLILLITHIPISIGGWGVREGLMIFFLSGYGVSDESALAISILAGLIQVLVSLLGGIIWMTYKGSETGA